VSLNSSSHILVNLVMYGVIYSGRRSLDFASDFGLRHGGFARSRRDVSKNAGVKPKKCREQARLEAASSKHSLCSFVKSALFIDRLQTVKSLV
jgi:hypothetical protein